MTWLKEEEYAAIGKFAASFGALEHMLLVIALKIDDHSKLPEKVIRGTFGQRLDYLEKVAKLANKLDVQLVDFIKNAKEGLAARNHFAHEGQKGTLPF